QSFDCRSAFIALPAGFEKPAWFASEWPRQLNDHPSLFVVSHGGGQIQVRRGFLWPSTRLGKSVHLRCQPSLHCTRSQSVRNDHGPGAQERAAFPGADKMTLKSKLVLVTGPNGWLGSRLIESLIHGLPDHPVLKQPAADLRIRCL